ncbi:MAG: hypothetical protein EXR77_11245 [Myxococcales bacterium]|nr:hypothetical protein [Myxococcales bacterium]
MAASVLRLPIAVALLTVMGLGSTLVTRPLWAEKTSFVGTFGAGKGDIALFDLVLGNGSGVKRGSASERGSQVFVRYELGGYIKSSTIGNLAGLEGGVEIGWDGVPKRYSPKFSDYMADIGMAADMWLGFPVTVLNLGDGNNDWLRWSVTPGMGSSLWCAYFYVKSAVAMQVAGVGDVELAATWWPDAANHAYLDRDALNAGALNTSLYSLKKWHLFVQYRHSQRVGIVALPTDDVQVYGGLTKAPNATGEPFGLEKRYDSEHVFTVGVGMIPFRPDK